MKGIEHEWEPFLFAQGYEFVYFDGLNRFYVAREIRNCDSTLPYPRMCSTNLPDLARSPCKHKLTIFSWYRTKPGQS